MAQICTIAKFRIILSGYPLFKNYGAFQYVDIINPFRIIELQQINFAFVNRIFIFIGWKIQNHSPIYHQQNSVF